MHPCNNFAQHNSHMLTQLVSVQRAQSPHATSERRSRRIRPYESVSAGGVKSVRDGALSWPEPGLLTGPE